jgi:hypothetical protein
MAFGGFGVSVGDAVAVGQFAWSVYKTCKHNAESWLMNFRKLELITTKRQANMQAANSKRSRMKVSQALRSQIPEPSKGVDPPFCG